MRAVFVGGPLNHARADLVRTPPFVEVCGVRYERIDDPDTGEYLGGYVFNLATPPATVASPEPGV